MVTFQRAVKPQRGDTLWQMDSVMSYELYEYRALLMLNRQVRGGIAGGEQHPEIIFRKVESATCFCGSVLFCSRSVERLAKRL